MALDSSDRIDAPWPRGGPLIITSGQVNIEASKTDWEWDIMTIPFNFVPIRAEIISQAVAITNGITIDVADDEATPQVMIQNQALAAITAGEATALSIVTVIPPADDTPVDGKFNDLGPFRHGSGLIFRYTSGASDTSVGTRVRLWVIPSFA